MWKMNLRGLFGRHFFQSSHRSITALTPLHSQPINVDPSQSRRSFIAAPIRYNASSAAAKKPSQGYSRAMDERRVPHVYFRLFQLDTMTLMNPAYQSITQRWKNYAPGFNYSEFIKFANESLYAGNYSALKEIMDPNLLEEVEFRLKGVSDKFLRNLNFPASYRRRFYPQILDFEREDDERWTIRTCHLAHVPYFEGLKRSRVTPEVFSDITMIDMSTDDYAEAKKMKRRYIMESVARNALLANMRFVKQPEKDWIITGINYFY